MVERKLISELLDWVQVSLSAFLCVMSFYIHYFYLLLCVIEHGPLTPSLTRIHPKERDSPSTHHDVHEHDSCYDQKDKTKPVKEKDERRLGGSVLFFFCQFVINVDAMPECGNDPVCEKQSKYISEEEYQICYQNFIASYTSLDSAVTEEVEAG